MWNTAEIGYLSKHIIETGILKGALSQCCTLGGDVFYMKCLAEAPSILSDPITLLEKRREGLHGDLCQIYSSIIPNESNCRLLVVLFSIRIVASQLPEFLHVNENLSICLLCSIMRWQ